MIVILLLLSWISSVASAFHDPPVSIATGMKMWILVMPVYFVFLAMMALSAAAPACKEVLSRWNCAYVSGTVTSQALSFPRAQGIKIAPSGRLASSRDRTHWLLGSWYLRLLYCSPYYVVDHSMADVSRSTLLACKAVQTSSVNLGATHHVWGWHVLDPRRCPTATLMAVIIIIIIYLFIYLFFKYPRY